MRAPQSGQNYSNAPRSSSVGSIRGELTKPMGGIPKVGI
jgi:hypothetical protein